METRPARRSVEGAARSLFEQSGHGNNLLVFGLFVFLAIECVAQILVFDLPLGVDLEIPLRAATRWASGGQPYLASSFLVQSGPDLPFLYPPWLLPFLAPLTALPRAIVTGPWLLLGVAVGAWTCRRLSIPWWAVPLVMLWTPFLEGLYTGNVQLWQTAAFAALFFVQGPAWELRPRDVERPAESQGADAMGALRHRRLRRDLLDGLLAACTGAVKYTQLLPLLWLLRRRPRAAVIGGLALVAVALVSLPLTGLSIYGDWIAQLGRAVDPGWKPAGEPLTFLVGRPLATVAAALAVMAMLFVRGRDAGAWVGIAMVVAAPSIHGYGLLLLLPALLTLRRDLSLVIAMLLTTYGLNASWLGIALTAAALCASRWVPDLRRADDR